MYTELIVNKNYLPQLNELCKSQENIKFNYTIYPLDNPKEKVDIVLNAKNDGLIIYKQADN